MRRLQAILLGLAASGVVACGPGAPDAPSPAQAVVGSGSPATALLERISEAPRAVAYQGTRRVSFEYELDGATTTLRYTERVLSTGDGRFAIDPIAIEAPAMSAREAELFLLMQKNREGFFYRYRDFRIDDLPAFLASYSIADEGGEPTIVGRACTELAIRRRRSAPTWYRAAVDAETGLVLRCEEIDDASGNVVARVEFLDLEIGPLDPALESEMHVDLPSSALDLHADTVAQIGFRVLVPRALPEGFELARAERVDDEEGRPWARLVYGDGASKLFLLHTEIAPEPGAAEPEMRSVRVFHVGPWVVAQGFLGRHRLIAMGKLEVATLLRTIESALP